MRLVFAGTPEFALPALDALVRAGHEILAVYTQPDRPFGRGRKLRPSPVAVRAATLKLPIRKPEKFSPDDAGALQSLSPEALVVVAYGLILPQRVLDIPKQGCFNIHGSLLPRWRGAAPIQRAILTGDSETGVTIMRMDAGLDTGAMLLREKISIGPADTAGDLQQALSALGARLMVATLEQLARGCLNEIPQPSEGATYAKKISKDEARLDWSRPAEELSRCVRAYNPAPIAWTEISGERVRIYRGEVVPQAGALPPGSVLNAGSAGIDVAAGADVFRILELQRPGGTVIAAGDAARSWKLDGTRFH